MAFPGHKGFTGCFSQSELFGVLDQDYPRHHTIYWTFWDRFALRGYGLNMYAYGVYDALGWRGRVSLFTSGEGDKDVVNGRR